MKLNIEASASLASIIEVWERTRERADDFEQDKNV